MTRPAPPLRDGPAPGLVFMFPGQSSRYPEMIEKITAADPDSKAIVTRASEALGRDLAVQYRATNPALFACNRNVQIGVFLANHLHLSLLARAGVSSAWSLGLSLGEYNHLVHIGALSFEDALALIDERGRLYDDGPPGIMVSVFPVGAAVVGGVIDDLGLRGRCVVALYNSPRQQVLSGERSAVERVVAALERDMLLDAVEIEPRIAMHATVFAPVAARFRAILGRAPVMPPHLPYVPNYTGRVDETATPHAIRECLAAHVCEPVRWQASIDAVADRVPSAYFIEVGPGAVLYNLFGRGWMPGRRARTDAAQGWLDHLRCLAAELRNGR